MSIMDFLIANCSSSQSSILKMFRKTEKDYDCERNENRIEKSTNNLPCFQLRLRNQHINGKRHSIERIWTEEKKTKNITNLNS